MLLIALLATFITVGHGLNSYVIMAPSKIRPNMELYVSVNILQASDFVRIDVTLERSSGIVVGSGTGVFLKGSSELLYVRVPPDLPSDSYILRVKGSEGLEFETTKDVQINSKEASVFIQLSKSIFKPADTVNFRVFGVYSSLRSFVEPMNISVYDADSNKIKQWIQATPSNGVIQKDLILSTQPVLGDWKISVETGKNIKEEKYFTVAKYVLPLFEVNIILPSYVLNTDSGITLTVKSKYTYGKPVKGKANVKVLLQRANNNIESAVLVSKMYMNIEGDAKVTVPMYDLLSLKTYLNQAVLIVIANVTESLTGNQMSGNGTVTLYDKDFILEFPEFNPQYFKPGLKYSGYLKVTQPDGLPLKSDQQVKITPKVMLNGGDITYETYPSYFNIPDNGLIQFQVDVPSKTISFSVTASFRGESEILTLKSSYSPSNSFIQVSLASPKTVKAGDIVSFEVRSTQPLSFFTYQVLSREGIVYTSVVNASNKLRHLFSLETQANMAPNARVVVYYVRDDGEIVTDSFSFEISGVFKNKVSIGFDQSEIEAGENVSVTVKADPNSAAYLLAIDQSVLLLKGGNDVTEKNVNDELNEFDSTSQSTLSIFDDTDDWWSDDGFGWWWYPIYQNGIDAKTVFEKAGVFVLTDATVYKKIIFHPRPRPWHYRPFNDFHSLYRAVETESIESSIDTDDSDVSISIAKPTVKLETPPRVRHVFSETFLWSDVIVGSNGLTSFNVTVPDTITSWVTSAFAISPVSGLGLAQSPAHLRVFKPFFVNLNLPYSVTRGEHLVLQANVFNYMMEDMQVRVTLKQSDSFVNILIDSTGREQWKKMTSVQDLMVKAGEAKSVYFPIIPTGLGKIDIEVMAQSSTAADAIRRQLLVEAEGIAKMYNVPVFIDLTGDKRTFSETVKLSLPDNIVRDSLLTRISVVGDLMGPTIAGLGSLLKLPTGCGEQTMVSLAPDVYVTDYLKSVGQLTEDIRTKTLAFMESGYQRELTYKHSDGSFSAFGNSDSSGSMWLTAFVIRVFYQAKSHIYVDENVLKKAIIWIVNKQNEDGSFPEPGNVLDKKLQSQAGYGVGLTLYVLIALEQNKDILYTVGGNAVQARNKALAYAEREIFRTKDLYILSLAAYAFQLSGSKQTQSVIDKLELQATYKDGRKYWHKPKQQKPPSNTWDYPNPSEAADIEMTSYVLLTYALRGDVLAGKSILRWLTEQRNSLGGYSSTQDTVMALNALSEFTKLVYPENYNIKISTRLNDTNLYQFDVDKTNSLVLQSTETTVFAHQVKIQAIGSGVALAQVAVSFNVEKEIFVTTFSLQVIIVEETMDYLSLQTCTRWTGIESSSGMAVQEIGIPSGFDADLSSLTKMDILKRVETENKKVVLYFDQINSTTVCTQLKVIRSKLVVKTQAVAVRVYDYYEPRNQVTTFYQSEILGNSTVCDVCKDCEQCGYRKTK